MTATMNDVVRLVDAVTETAQRLAVTDPRVKRAAHIMMGAALAISAGNFDGAIDILHTVRETLTARKDPPP